jgi:hypothetical protein
VVGLGPLAERQKRQLVEAARQRSGGSDKPQSRLRWIVIALTWENTM